MSGRPGQSNPPDSRERAVFADETCTIDVSLRLGEFPLAPVSNRSTRALLLRMDGVHAGSVFSVDQLPCTIGRHATNMLRIDEDSISRFHARIIRDNQGFVLEDLESRNGTFVGGKRIKRHRLTDGEGLTFGAKVAFHFSVTDSLEEHLLRRLYESSTRDALTGAYNRSHFDERLRAEVAFAARHAGETSLVMIDLDHFKRVNDTYGHAAGDAVLKELAAVSQRQVRSEDVFARFGGEEFAVVLRGIGLDGATTLGERLRIWFERTPIVFEGKTLTVTLSAGCASMACCPAPVTPKELIRVADRRLYLAKAKGRNRVIARG
jgi:two-component system cell cycle response regulator